MASDKVAYLKFLFILILCPLILKHFDFKKYILIIFFLLLMLIKNIIYDGIDGVILFIIGLYAYVTFTVILININQKLENDVNNILFIIVTGVFFLIYLIGDDNFRFTQVINPNNMGLYGLGMLFLSQNSGKYHKLVRLAAISIICLTMSRGIALSAVIFSLMFYVNEKNKINLIQLILLIIICVNVFIYRGNVVSQNMEESGRVGQIVKAVKGMNDRTTIIYDKKFSNILVSNTINNSLKSYKYIKYIWGDSFGAGTNALVNLGYRLSYFNIDILKYNRGTADSGVGSLFINGGIIFYLLIFLIYIKFNKNRRHKYSILLPIGIGVILLAQAFNETFPGVFLLLLGINIYRSEL
jgi:hypothetical protein